MVQAEDLGSDAVDLDGMEEYLEGTETGFAVLFGSYAQGSATESSDVDVALRFPDELDERERFRARNRIDAHLQEYADGHVDVSDIDSLPTEVANAALRDAIVITGAERDVETYKKTIEREYDETITERQRDRREFIDRLARGDT